MRLDGWRTSLCDPPIVLPAKHERVHHHRPKGDEAVRASAEPPRLPERASADKALRSRFWCVEDWDLDLVDLLNLGLKSSRSTAAPPEPRLVGGKPDIILESQGQAYRVRAAPSPRPQSAKYHNIVPSLGRRTCLSPSRWRGAVLAPPFRAVAVGIMHGRSPPRLR